MTPTLTPTSYRTLPIDEVWFGDGDSLDRFETVGHLPARTVIAAANRCARAWGYLSLARHTHDDRLFGKPAFLGYAVDTVTHAWATHTPCPGAPCDVDTGHLHWPTIHAERVPDSWPVTVAWIEGQPVGQPVPSELEG